MTWPGLPLEVWGATQQTLHLWTQVVGKVRMALTPLVNHWWNCTLYATPRGLTTGIMHHGLRPLEIAFDFVDHRLLVDAAGARRALALEPRSVADFHRELLATLADLDAPVRIHPMPQEVADPIPFTDDEAHADYDPDAVARFHHVLLLADQTLRPWRARFVGKCSPVHFFWGSFDLAVTRFSGRPAPPHPGGVPHMADWVAREGYFHECVSAGWWPGNGAFGRPAYYAYSYPEPDGFREGASLPPGAYYDESLREYLLPWDDVTAAADPAGTVTAFLDAVYDRAARAADWDPALLRDAREAARLEARVRSTSAPLASASGKSLESLPESG